MQTVSTRSFRLAAFLLAKGHSLTGSTREADAGPVTFRFAGDPTIDSDVDALRYGVDDRVAAGALFDAQDRLKRVIFDRDIEP